jgi:hypothetical protein
MNPQEAKEILSLYRPGTADANDPWFGEALRLSESDPVLKSWLDEHCATYLALRSRFKLVPVPEGLKEQIVAERKSHTTPAWRRPAVLIAASAAVTILTAIVSLWVLWTPPGDEDLSYNGYVDRMVSTAIRGYGAMDLATDDYTRLRAYLTQHGAPADPAMPRHLQQATLIGCRIQYWQGAKVSMICFRSGKPLPPGQATDLWLFVSERAAVSGAPAPNLPVVTKGTRATTAGWSRADKTYVLVADGDVQFLRKYL